MNATVAVALITAVSTLAGGALSGFISLSANRAQAKLQYDLAQSNLIEQRSAERRRLRRDVYEQFLTQASRVENEIRERWETIPPKEADSRKYIRDIIHEINNLQHPLSLVALEGTGEVVEKSKMLRTFLWAEAALIAKLHERAYESKSPYFVIDIPKEYTELSTLRNSAKNDVIIAARNALDGDADSLEDIFSPPAE